MFRINPRRTVRVYSSQLKSSATSLLSRRTNSASCAVIDRFWMAIRRSASTPSGSPSRPSKAVKIARRSPAGMITA
jgi:translation initiation factor 2B subunit (eIF-2B alpha/beta/delta family)